MPFPLAAVIGAAGSIAGGIGSALIGNSGTRQNMRLQAKLNKEQLAYQDALNRNYQNMLWSKQYQAQISGMKNAGLNPAMANGTSVGGATASNALSSGSPGPSGAMPHIDPVEGAVAAMNAEKDMDIKDSQKELLDAQANNVRQDTAKKAEETSENKFRNSDDYRRLILRGMSENVANTVADTAQKYSSVDLNVQKVAESAQNVEESLSRIGLNEEQAKKAAQEAVEVTYKIAERLQNIKESKARVVYYQAAAANQSSLAELNKETKRGQGISNDDLERWYNAKKSVTVPVYGPDGKPTGNYRSYWGNAVNQESTKVQIENDLLEYDYEVMKTMTPAERQRYIMMKDAGKLSVDALGALNRKH